MSRLGGPILIGRVGGIDTQHTVYVETNGTIRLHSQHSYSTASTDYRFSGIDVHELIRALRLAEESCEAIAEHHEKLTAQSDERLARIFERSRRRINRR